MASVCHSGLGTIQESSTTAMQTLKFASFFRVLLFQIRFYSLQKALFTLARLLSTSISILASDVIAHHNYINS